MHEVLSANFKQAACDYTLFLEKKYSEKQVLKLVAARYRLLGLQKSMLYRGITTNENSKKRRGKKAENIEPPLIVDGYNVSFTITNYLLGKTVFRSNDSFIRDVGELYKKPVDKPQFQSAVDLILEYINTEGISAIVFIDSQVTGVEKLGHKLSSFFLSYKLDAEVSVSSTVDEQLLKSDKGTICTSDSKILDKTVLPVFDLPDHILENNFSPSYIDLIAVLGKSFSEGSEK